MPVQLGHPRFVAEAHDDKKGPLGIHSGVGGGSRTAYHHCRGDRGSMSSGYSQSPLCLASMGQFTVWSSDNSGHVFTRPALSFLFKPAEIGLCCFTAKNPGLYY